MRKFIMTLTLTGVTLTGCSMRGPDAFPPTDLPDHIAAMEVFGGPPPWPYRWAGVIRARPANPDPYSQHTALRVEAARLGCDAVVHLRASPAVSMQGASNGSSGVPPSGVCAVRLRP